MSRRLIARLADVLTPKGFSPCFPAQPSKELPLLRAAIRTPRGIPEDKIRVAVGDPLFCLFSGLRRKRFVAACGVGF
jgi:hypothetical protein